MGKFKGKKSLKKSSAFDFGYIILFLFIGLFIFLIGRTYGKREIYILEKKLHNEINDNLINNKKLLILNQI